MWQVVSVNGQAELDRPHLGLFGLRKMPLQISVLAASFLLLYGSVFASFAGMWVDHDRLEGFLIPLISLYLVWLKREELRTLHLKPALTWGLHIVALAGILLVLGEAGGVVVLGEISLIVMIVGLVLLLLGKEFLKALCFPIAYLLFMLSLPLDVVAPLHWPFQLQTANMAVELLQLLDFTALVEGRYILLPHITLEVARTCSGVNYLISIIAIGFPLAYLTLRAWWSRVTLVLSAVAIGVAANWVRVAIIAIWSYWGGEVLHGPFHIFQGMFVAWVGFVVLFVGAWALSKLDKPVSENRVLRPPRLPHPSNSEADSRVEWNRSWRMAMVILIVFAVYLFSYDRGQVGLKQDFAHFPISIGGWSGERVELQEADFRIRGADDELARTYRDAEGRRIQLYVAYLNSQRQGKEIVNYHTAVLHQDTDEVKIPVGPNEFLSVNRTRYGAPKNGGRI